MGNLFNKQKNKSVLVLGVANAGKTSIVQKLANVDDPLTTQPHAGFKVTQVSLKTVKLSLWDVGGQDTIRNLWRHYYASTSILIYVIDASDRSTLSESLEAFRSTISDDELNHVYVLILCNKIDVEGALTPAEISKELNTATIKQAWSMMPISAKTGQGFLELLTFLDNPKQ